MQIEIEKRKFKKRPQPQPNSQKWRAGGLFWLNHKTVK